MLATRATVAVLLLVLSLWLWLSPSAALASAAPSPSASSASSSATAPLDPRGEDWQGLAQLVHLAREEIGTQRVVVTPVLPLGKLERDDALVIIHPTRTLDVDALESFMRAGGRVVLLDDYGTGDELLSRFHIFRVPMPERPARMLRGNPSFAIAEPASDHPATREAAHVVTNHATGLEQPALQRLLVVRGDPEGDVTLAVAGVVGQGRFLAVGDASVVMNSMLRFPGNRALAAGLVRYAASADRAGERAERGGKVYFLANDFEVSGSFGDDSTLASAWGDARRLGTGALETLRRDGMPSPVLLALSALVTLAIIASTIQQAGRTYRPAVLRFVRPVLVSAQGGWAGRSAALGLPQAAPAEQVKELKRALEDAVAARTSVDMGSPGNRLIESARQMGLLSKEELDDLAQLLKELREVEARLARPAPLRAWGAVVPLGAALARPGHLAGLAARVQAMLGALASAPAPISSVDGRRQARAPW